MDDLFLFRSVDVAPERSDVALSYRVVRDGIPYDFTEHYQFPVPLPDTPSVTHLLRELHLAAGTSYYKLYAPQQVEHPYALSGNGTDFWNKVYRYGLREFWFTNQLSDDRVPSFSSVEGGTGVVEDTCRDAAGAARDGCVLLGIGGGKDSVVAGELLKGMGVLKEAFVVVTNEVPAPVQAVADAMNVPLSVVRRQLDPALKRLSARPDALNGHIPISVIFAITGCLLALSQGATVVAVGNEASASIPHMRWRGMEVNHQWSKSLRFETMWQARLQALGVDVAYCSPIRSLNSVCVAALFAPHRVYHTVFTSDSSAFRIDPDRRPASRWTLQSGKSLSSYILLLPWLNACELHEIFGRDFLDVPELEPMLKRLLGVGDERVLDCVGTPAELRLSLECALSQGKCADSVLAQQALRAQWVMNRPDAWRTLEKTVVPAAEQAFPAALASSLETLIAQQLAQCRSRLTPRGVSA